MGALFSSLLETLLGESGHWIENGFRRGYFPLGKHWEAADVQYAKQMLQQAASVRVTDLSLVGQTFESPQIRQDLLQLVVSRPELETLRLERDNDNVGDVVVVQRSVDDDTKRLLRVEHFMDTHQVAAYWRDVSQLPCSNMLVLTKKPTADKV